MASKAKFVKIFIGTGHPASLSGYKVLGDVTEGSERVLLLERPDQVATTRKARTKKVNAQPMPEATRHLQDIPFVSGGSVGSIPLLPATAKES